MRQASEARRVLSTNGRVGVFWLAREPTELQRFLEMIAPAGLQLVRAVRLNTIRSLRIAPDEGHWTYLLVLQPMPAAASPVVVDGETVLALATEGALSLYDGLAELLESTWDPGELNRLIPEEPRVPRGSVLPGFSPPSQNSSSC